MTSAEQPPELWPTTRCAEYCGVKPGTWRYYRSRLGAPAPVSRQTAAQGGEDLYDPQAVIEWQANRAGQGARTDLRDKVD